MKIQILSMPRAGSTYVYSLINNVVTPNVSPQTINEPFNYTARYPHLTSTNRRIELTQRIIQNLKNSTDTVVKNHISHFDNIELPALVTEFRLIDWYTIVLLRRDLFKSALSLAVSTITHEWITYDNNTTPVAIEPEHFLKELDHVIYSVRNIVNNVHGFKYNQVIFYEDLTFDPQHDFNMLRFSQGFDYDRRAELFPDYQMFPNMKWVEQSPEKTQQVTNYWELHEHAVNYLKNMRGRRFGVRGTRLVDIHCKMN